MQCTDYSKCKLLCFLSLLLFSWVAAAARPQGVLLLSGIYHPDTTNFTIYAWKSRAFAIQAIAAVQRDATTSSLPCATRRTLSDFFNAWQSAHAMPAHHSVQHSQTVGRTSLTRFARGSSRFAKIQSDTNSFDTQTHAAETYPIHIVTHGCLRQQSTIWSGTVDFVPTALRATRQVSHVFRVY